MNEAISISFHQSAFTFFIHLSVTVLHMNHSKSHFQVLYSSASRGEGINESRIFGRGFTSMTCPSCSYSSSNILCRFSFAPEKFVVASFVKYKDGVAGRDNFTCVEREPEEPDDFRCPLSGARSTSEFLLALSTSRRERSSLLLIRSSTFDVLLTFCFNPIFLSVAIGLTLGDLDFLSVFALVLPVAIGLTLGDLDCLSVLFLSSFEELVIEDAEFGSDLINFKSSLRRPNQRRFISENTI